MWTLIVVLMLGDPHRLIVQEQSMTFSSQADCGYARQFVPEGHRLGDWIVTRSVCEIRTAV